MENKEKIDYLKSLFTVTDFADEGCSFEAPDCYDAWIAYDDFEVGDSAEEICRNAEYLSCCGDVLDKDYMICPTCYEHC